MVVGDGVIKCLVGGIMDREGSPFAWVWRQMLGRTRPVAIVLQPFLFFL